MKVKMNTAKEVVKSIDLRVSPIEFMIIKDALYVYTNPGIIRADADKEKATKMYKEINKLGKENKK